MAKTKKLFAALTRRGPHRVLRGDLDFAGQPGVVYTPESGLSLPGVAFGTMLVSEVNPAWLKFATFIALLPLILLQAAGYRRPIKSERSVGLLFGGGVGILYSVTTISGPPLAVMLSNQGLTKRDFRAALGFIRLAESSFTAVAYAWAGLYSLESLALIPFIVPSIAIGVPIGAQI